VSGKESHALRDARNRQLITSGRPAPAAVGGAETGPEAAIEEGGKGGAKIQLVIVWSWCSVLLIAASLTPTATCFLAASEA
jgi:hypothetical protein